MVRFQLYTTGTLKAKSPARLKVVTGGIGRQHYVLWAGNSAGKTDVYTAWPPSGLLNGPGSAPPVILICWANGASSTMLLLKIPLVAESKNMPAPPRKLVLPSPNTSRAKPARGPQSL